MPRLTEARYDDALGALYQGADPMEVASRLFDQDASDPAESGVSALFTTWGQFLDHDLSLTPEGDQEVMDNPAFAHGVGRSAVMEGTGDDEPRAYGNAITWQIDGSMIYGSNTGRTDDVRAFEGGRLDMSQDATSPYGLLPQTNPQMIMAGEMEGEEAVYLAGDVRANENPNLLSLHTLFAREHNYWADRLAEEHPDWDDEQLFEGAREIVEYELQAITYGEWLPLLIGNAVPEDTAHDPDVDGQVALEFSTAAFRFGHTIVASRLDRVNDDGSEAEGGHQALMEAFFNPELVREQGIDAYLRGMAGQAAEELDTKVVDDLNFFLQTPDGVSGFSLPALNLMRGADHGMDSYVSVRAQLLGDIDPATLDPQDFSIVTNDSALQAELAAVYDDVFQVDLWVGGLAEDKVAATMMGPLFTHIISDQFTRTAQGDETFGTLNEDLGDAILAEVRASGMKDVILRNSMVDHIQDDPFLMETRTLTEVLGIKGTDSNDTLDLTAKDVRGDVVAGHGDDDVTVIGGSHVDGMVDLGSGDDSFSMTSGSASGMVMGGAGDDDLTLGGTAQVADLDAGGDDDCVTLTDRAEAGSVTTGNGDDRVTLSGQARVGAVRTGNEDDIVWVGPDAQVDLIELGNSDDALHLDGGGVLRVDGGNGLDRLTLGKGAKVAFDDGSDTDGVITWADGQVTRFECFEVAPCFTPGTLVVTALGKRPIETLRPGARVLTVDHGLQPIRWIGRTTVPARGRFAPVRIEAGALDNRAPLIVSPQHRIVLTSALAEVMFGDADVLVPAIALTGRDGIAQVEGGAVDYIHILFDTHQIVLAGGIPSESFHPGPQAMSAIAAESRSEVLTLFPELHAQGYGPDARPALRGREARLLARLMT
ncbi:peroxidase family protein [Jannaschia sp. M317]|uniref:peroxidase family protein n=1 Tax=Jannaschia sp. M317 TaxID=2867011 RepID=UPI0021A58054|nr:peroxidase family protein [Jannaschia sp. M317]UWQ16613.1 Hint domain-containing protein [Jannaschia sp. M317]